MRIRSLVAGLMPGVLALALVALAAPASAQTGGVRGQVVDDAGKPVEGVTVVFNSPEGLGTITLKTNAKGEYFSIGARPGDYTVKASKGNLTASIGTFHIGIGDPSSVPTMKVLSPTAAASASSGNADADKARAKKQAEVQAAFKSANDAVDAGQFDDAIAQYTKITLELTKCSSCYVGIGVANAKKGDNDAAEAAYKKAIDVDPASPDPYSAIAAFYNTQKKFDDAAKMSAKANELAAASGAAGDPISVFNQGVILWNQNKAAEAQVQFEKTTKLDPKMADAYYFLGMTFVNQGKLPEAKAPFTTYMSLAPTGKYADQVKGLLTLIK